MPNAANIDPTAGKVSILLKSDPGFGKTIAATSFAVFGKVYLAYFDKREPTELWTYYKSIGRGDLLANIDYDIYSSKNANDFYNKLVGFLSDFRYIALIVDGVTNITSAAVNWSLNFSDGGIATTRDKLTKPSEITPDFDEYKVETSYISNCLDMCKLINGYNIWTAHPVPRMNIEKKGSKIEITKTHSLVSYGNKVGAIIPGNFTEIYHLGTSMDYSSSPVRKLRTVYTNAVGEDFAKSSLGVDSEFDVTDKLFAEVWMEQVKAARDRLNGIEQRQ